MAAMTTEITIKFDAKDRRVLNRLLQRIEELIVLLIKDQADATEEQDTDVPSGPAEGD